MPNVLSTSQNVGQEFSVLAQNQGPVQVRVVPAGGGGDLTPLSHLFVVDPSGTGTTRDGAWSGAQAFTTLAEAIAAVPDGSTLVLMPGDYSTEGGEAGLTWEAKSLAFWSFAPKVGDVLLPHLTATIAGGITVWNCTTKNLTAADGYGVVAKDSFLDGALAGSSATCTQCSCTSATEFLCDGFVDLYTNASAFTTGSALPVGPNTYTIIDAELGNAELTHMKSANGLRQPSYVPVLMADATPVTILASQGSYFDFLDPITQNITVKLGDSDSPRAGIALHVRRFDKSAFSVTVTDNADVALFTFATSETGELTAVFDGAVWLLAGVTISQEP